MKITPIAEVRSTISLGGEDRTLVFNANTMVAYEQATGKFFLHTVSNLLNAAYPDGSIAKNPYEILSRVSMADLRALLWAAMHEYDKNDDPIWPLTLSQVGRLLTLKEIIPAFSVFLKGQMANNPSGSELGESQAEKKIQVSQNPPPITQESGGELGIELPADAFA